MKGEKTHKGKQLVLIQIAFNKAAVKQFRSMTEHIDKPTFDGACNRLRIGSLEASNVRS